jgi:hypothetical protein
MSRHLVAPLVFTLVFGSLVALSAKAATLMKVKGDQVLIDLQGEASQYSEGSRYLVMVDGKKKAVVEVSKIKGQRAIGKVLKGTAFENGTLAPLPGASSPSSNQASASSSQRRSTRTSRRHNRRGGAFKGMSYGAMAGYGLTSQDVTATKNGVTESISMTGNSLSLKGFVDLPVSGDFGVIGRVGFENFGVKGTSASLGAVETNILYLDADLLARYHFLTGAFHPFPMLGMGLHYPLSKSSGVLDVQRISATTIFFVGGGFNYSLSDSMYIHAVAEYGIFPPSNDVSTSLIAIRGGVGWAL